MSSLGNLIFVLSGCASENANVKGPNLPKNMIKIITVFPTKVSEPVIPIDNPTVPNAEITSNATLRNGASSVMFKRKMAIQIKISPMVEIANDRNTTVWLMDRLPTTVVSFPFKNVITAKSIIKKVVSLIPPPVEALPAPINISIRNKHIVASSRAPISMVLNPAVLGVTAWK